MIVGASACPPSPLAMADAPIIRHSRRVDPLRSV